MRDTTNMIVAASDRRTPPRIVLDAPVQYIALGPGLVYANGFVTFTHVAQRRLAIQAVIVAAPADQVNDLDAVTVTFVTHTPEHALVQRFEDGSTISDEGIKRVTYTLKPALEKLSEELLEYRPQLPTNEETGPHWFVQNGIGYLGAEVGAHVVVRVHNRSNQDVEARGLILYKARVPAAIKHETGLVKP
jgi:hypothetical protein